MEMQKKSILLYLDMLPMLESLPPASCGKVVLALLRYASDGKVPKGFRGAEKMALEFIRAQIDRDTVSAVNPIGKTLCAGYKKQQPWLAKALPRKPWQPIQIQKKIQKKKKTLSQRQI